MHPCINCPVSVRHTCQSAPFCLSCSHTCCGLCLIGVFWGLFDITSVHSSTSFVCWDFLWQRKLKQCHTDCCAFDGAGRWGKWLHLVPRSQHHGRLEMNSTLADFNSAVLLFIHQSAKFNSPPIFPAIW